MDIASLEIRYYQTTSGRCPFRDWFESLDMRAQVVIDKRLARVRRGLLGDSESVGGGIFEFRVDFGPGYRIYYARGDRGIVILLHAGDKRSQSADIRAAEIFWKEYLWRIGR